MTASVAAKAPVILGIFAVLALVDDGGLRLALLLITVFVLTGLGRRLAAAVRRAYGLPATEMSGPAEAAVLIGQVGVVALVLLPLDGAPLGLRIFILVGGVVALEAAGERLGGRPPQGTEPGSSTAP